MKLQIECEEEWFMNELALNIIENQHKSYIFKSPPLFPKLKEDSTDNSEIIAQNNQDWIDWEKRVKKTKAKANKIIKEMLK